MTPIKARYRIIFDALAQAHFIVDDHMEGARCCLPDRNGRLVPLRFRTGRAARDWLHRMGRERYQVEQVGQGYAIWDRTLNAFCGFGAGPFAWSRKAEAEGWLTRCYRVWGCRPVIGEEPPPVTPTRPVQRYQHRQPWDGFVRN